MVTRATRRRVLRRDARICGLHMRGCHRPIEEGAECNVDHIIPKALFTMLTQHRANDFEADWNYQPMHIKCHEEKRDRLSGRGLNELEKAVTVGTITPDDWPRYECQCHYLQIDEGDLFVKTQGSIGNGRHLLYAGVVKDFGNEDRQDAILVIGRWTGPEHIPTAGYSRRGNSERGFLLPSYSPRRVPGFNIMQARRVGLPSPQYIYIDDKGYVTPLEDTVGERLRPIPPQEQATESG